MKTAKDIVASLLEDYDEHVNAYNRIQTFDKAIDSHKHLMGLEKQRLGLMASHGSNMRYLRALAWAGLRREDVTTVLRGDMIAATDNYRAKVPSVTCSNPECRKTYVLSKADTCGNCGAETVSDRVTPSPSVLRGKLGRYIVGVVTNDGRKVFFENPVPPANQLD